MSHRFKIPADWKSGYYTVTLSVEDRGGAFVQRNRRTATGDAFFVVRATDRAGNRDTNQIERRGVNLCV